MNYSVFQLFNIVFGVSKVSRLGIEVFDFVGIRKASFESHDSREKHIFNRDNSFPICPSLKNCKENCKAQFILTQLCRQELPPFRLS